MSFSIRILPSNHTYSVEPQETLLEGALRSGIHLKYSCENGSCGECEARLVKGDLGPVDYHDYTFNENEKRDGKILLCRSHAASDLVIEAIEASSPQDIPLQTVITRVSRIERLDDSRLILHLRTPRSKTLRFLAGQHVQLRINSKLARDLPIASCPCNGMLLQFHLHDEPGDPFTHYIFNKLVHSALVEVAGPYGTFTLDEASSRPIIMIALDEGFAVFKSLIEHAINLEVPQRLSLYWLASDSGGHYLDNYCRSLQEALDTFSYLPLVLSAGEDVEEGILRLVRQIIEKELWIEETDIYLAVPLIHRELVGYLLEAAGVPISRIFTMQMRDERKLSIRV